MHRQEIASVVRDLLTIAKVAMPDDLDALDPRIGRALDTLSMLTSDDIGSLGPTEDVATAMLADPDGPEALGVLAALDEATLPASDITSGLDAFMASGEAPASPSAAITGILRDWLGSRGYLSR